MTIGVFDLSNYAKRAYFAAYPKNGPREAMTNEGGMYAEMMKLALSFIKTDLTMVRLDHCVIAVDFAVDSWRKKLYPQYKCNRPPPNAEWIRQINFLIDVLGALGIKSLWRQGLEADDLFGVVVGNFPKEDVVLFTNDKDSYQLLTNRRVKIWNPYDRVYIKPDDVFRKFHVGPEHIRAYLALNGDSGDDIPGLFKVGPVTASNLLLGKDGRTVEEWIKQERKDPEGDLAKYQLYHKLTAMVTDPSEALFPWPHLTYDDIKIGKPDPALFRYHWTAKGKIDSKPHPLLALISASSSQGGFDEDD